MHFVFVESFAINCWNGEICRFKKGISGSHNAPMYLGEGLAKQGHEVEFVSILNNMEETTYNDVTYINYDNYMNVTCDYVITTNNLLDFKIFNKIKDFKKVFILMQNEIFCMHNDVNSLEQYFKSYKENIIITYLNESGKTNIEFIQPFLKDYKSIILPNSIDLNDIKQFDISKKENSVCFFACVERGLKLTIEIVNKLDNFIIYSNTYADENRHLIKASKKLIQTQGTSKYDISNYLVKSKYFIYPLINLDNNCIHYDTFAYVILEAILHGVIVIVPRIKSYEDLYGDSLCYVDSEGIISDNDLIHWRQSNTGFKFIENFGYPLLDKYIEKVNLLENDEELRKEYILKGLEVGKKYSNEEIMKKFMEHL